ncbi:MAG: DEAD/DEAH box helicase [Rectinemataceae bacterium]|jgi:superfamily II DNA or RNA helicase
MSASTPKSQAAGKAAENKKHGRPAKAGRAKAGAAKAATVPYHKKPEAMSYEAWQLALRKHYVPEEAFTIRSLGGAHPIFCDYSVYNPASGRSYKVALRDGARGRLNYCECLDFKTNRLGTCKHVEAVLSFVGKKRGAKKVLQEGFVPPYTSVYLRYGEERRVLIRIGTEHSVEFETLASGYFDADGLLLPEAENRFELFLERAAKIDEAFRCYDDALAFVLSRRETARRKALLEAKYAAPESLDGLLKTKLYPYQRRGILFAATSGRSLIADEMGLGKTIQAIGAALLFKREVGIERVLVVCPTSLKYQWRSEVMKFTDESVRVIEGPIQVREKQYREEGFFKIVSYHALAHDLEAIARMDPDLVILDEAQRIKNWKTRLARSVKRIESTYAIVLTGTPLENNLEELYSIVEFVDHYKLGPFWRFLAEHQIKGEGGKVTGYRGLSEIAGLLSDISLRRRKKEVLEDLPGRIDKRVFVPMTAQQRNIHEEFAESVGRLTQKWKHRGFLTEEERQHLLILLNQMRMSCDSTFVLDQDIEHRHDTKIDELMGVLEECLADPEQKIVVFSQWERMTRLVALELDERKIGYRSLSGDVPSAKRAELFDTFNGDPDCHVFLSTDAGSTGLNLQSASILINLDLPWNPAVREQRIGRIHRIGQKRNITVLDFVSIDTIESRMLDVLSFKSDLARGILDSGEDSIFMGEDKYRRFMNAVSEVAAAPEGSESAPASLAANDEDEGETAELAESRTPSASPDAGELLSRGVSFLSDLSQALSEPGGAERLVAAISDTDPETGRMYLKIPVEGSASAIGAITALAGLFSAISAKARDGSVEIKSTTTTKARG